MNKTTLKKSDFPETVHGLLSKSKSDLLNIIARKDDVETRLTRENSELRKKLDELNTVVLEQSGVITKSNKLMEETNTSLNLADEQLRLENYKLHKDFSNCFITLIVVVIVLIGVLIYFI